MFSVDQSKFLVSSSIHPQTRNVLRTRAQFLGIEIKAIDDYDNHQLNQLDSGDILEQEGEGVFGLSGSIDVVYRLLIIWFRSAGSIPRYIWKTS